MIVTQTRGSNGTLTIILRTSISNYKKIKINFSGKHIKDSNTINFIIFNLIDLIEGIEKFIMNDTRTDSCNSTYLNKP